MADKNIGALPQAPNLNDDSLMVVEQQGTAMKMTGAQFKEFGKLGVMQDVGELVEEAQAAADRAADAVRSVVDMTVEASTLDSGAPATVTKTIKQGKVNLSFGLPRGAQGVPGPEGKEGPRGPQGVPGTGLKILGYYDAKEDLEAAVTDPKAGDAYGVGAEAPYDIYIFDGVANAWKNNGPMSGGGGGGVVPENVVTSEGGASFEYGAEAGAAPHVITLTNEEEPPLTAEDVNYNDTQTVKDAIDGLKASVSDGKALIASAITDKGVDTAQDATFSQLAENIGRITTGTDTSDATAGAGDILSPKTAYTASGKVTGRIPSLGAQTITPGTSARSIAGGQYLSGPQTIAGDPNLTSASIKKGVSIFGVAGAVESTFKATLTVTVEAGAEVRAACGEQSISALSTNGTVVLELPSEGKWRVTAARGMTQYSTAIVDVTSSYQAALTAEIYIEYYGAAPVLSAARSNLAAPPVSGWTSEHRLTVFAGGNTAPNAPVAGRTYQSDAADAYNENLTKTTLQNLFQKRQDLAAANLLDFMLFAGGWYQSGLENFCCDTVDMYDGSGSHSYMITPLSAPRAHMGAAAVDGHILFGGGWNVVTRVESSAVDAYDSAGTRTSAPVLAGASSLRTRTVGRGTPDGEYALFANLHSVTAYDTKLVRSTPSALGVVRGGYTAANAGNYTLFAGGDSKEKGDVVEAYDLFLTRTTPQALAAGREAPAAASLDGYAVFTGGLVPGEDYKYPGGADVYNAQLVRTGSDNGLLAEGAAGTVVGGFALFGGGCRYAPTGTTVTRYNTVSAFHRVIRG